MKTVLKKIVGSSIGIALAVIAQAGGLTNNFDSGADFVNNGVIGTMWDGVYLGFGDVPGGDNGGDGDGATILADENTFPGFLTVQSTDSSWAGTGDDGFYLWKVVAGDFDVSVRNAQPFNNSPYHFAGLLVRAYTTRGPAWGAPFGAAGTNAENWLNITRFNEFSIGDQVRYATNATDIQISAPYNSGSTNYNTETNDDRYFRITRTGDTFSFYDKTNQSDAWVLETNVMRNDLDGIPMQVGIEDATFSGATPITYFTDFELSGTNVNPTVTLPADPLGLTASVTSSNVVTFSWTPGTGSSGSILVVRANNPLVLNQKPVNGFTYNANTNFGSGDNLGDNIYVVDVGASSSAKITGLGSIVDTNYAAVYSYSGSGSSTIYGANPATTMTSGSEPVVGVALTLFPTNIPLNGVAAVQVAVTYGNGSITINPVSGVTLTSSAPTIADAANGIVSGMAIGTASIVASYAGFSSTNDVSVITPAYADNFNVPHNYLANGLPGSAWDGLYLRNGDLPNETYVGASVQTTGWNADVTSNGVLTLTAANSYWAGTGDNGPLLFKYVPGDFQAAVHMTSIPRLTTGAAAGDGSVGYMFAGLMARAAAADGSPYNGSENWVYWSEFDQYSDSTEARTANNGADTEYPIFDSLTKSDYWLLMQRVNSTNFYFYRKLNATDPWQPRPDVTITRPDLTNGVPVQVGLFQATYTGNSGTVQFDSFMLDAANISGGTPPSQTTNLVITYDATNDTMTLTWTPGTNSDGSVQTSFVVMRQGAPVSAQPYFGILTTASSVFGQGTDLGSGNYLVYRDVGNTVTVSGLTAGAVYYAAVYGYSGSGATKTFNEAGSASGSIQAGNFVGISASLNGGIPLGGVGLPIVMGLLQGGGSVDVSSSATVTSGNTNIMVAANDVLTGLAIGSATNIVMFQSGTNIFTTNLIAAVRAPSYTDGFSVNHDYLANGTTNTTWDGVYEYPAFTIPDTTFVSDPAASVFSADANISSNNVLTITSENVGWENTQDDGFFLFKYVPADFQMAVHITTPLLDANSNVVASYNYPGLLARPYSVDTSGNVGAPLDTTNGDSWVSWARFDEFGIGTRAELILDNRTTAAPSTDVADGQLWLLMVRQHGTKFTFYQKANATDPWQPAPAGQEFSVTNFTGLPMQVGIEEGGFDSGNPVTAQFDSFMLDEQLLGPTITISSSSGNINLSWPTTAGAFALESTPSLNPANWQPVTATSVTNNGIVTVTIPITSSEAFFRLAQ